MIRSYSSFRDRKKIKLTHTFLTSIGSLPDSVLNHSVGAFCDDNSLAFLAHTSQHHYTLFRKNKTGQLRKRAVNQLLLHVVNGEQEEAEAMTANNHDLLLEIDQVPAYAQDTIVKGTAFRVALAGEDDQMAAMIAAYLDEYYPGEKLEQYQAQFPAGEEKVENLRQEEDLIALQKIVTAISQASNNACEQMSNNEDNIAEDDEEMQRLAAVFYEFRELLKPKNTIETGKQFNIQLLIEAFKLYDKNYEVFGGWNSHKNNLVWCKIIGYIQRFLPASYAQALSQGVNFIIEEGEILQRSFNFRFGIGKFFPLDLDPQIRLGYDYAVAWPAGGGELLEKLYRAKTAALHRVTHSPCNPAVNLRD
ncbi:hypothetical protein [Coxiella burnetii]|uniref:hypothetical protein n=1 Tax=Coxiella burnetii TaxID=777 RepID=UPI00051F190D|nr:hypothetical protein [Coxiella burnetii]AIT64318.1 hypothetical protein CBNA_2139 [Coxiella burnetii str. Namibia]